MYSTSLAGCRQSWGRASASHGKSQPFEQSEAIQAESLSAKAVRAENLSARDCKLVWDRLPLDKDEDCLRASTRC